jgi:hypothetical protein
MASTTTTTTRGKKARAEEEEEECTHTLFLYDSIHDQLDNWSHPYHIDY